MDEWLHPTIQKDVITYPCSNPDAGLDIILVDKKRP